MLSQKNITIIKSTVPVLETTGTAITKRFYDMLFEAHPELLNIFNQANQKKGRQQTALANTVYAAALHIEHLEKILPAVEKIAHKHRSLGVKPEHYPIVGEYLLKAIKEVLKEDATEEILSAWEEAYGVIANVFISVEKEMYNAAETKAGGWKGFKELIIAKKVKESSLITSFYLETKDQSSLPAYNPGQYVTVQVQIPGERYTMNRQYSLSQTYNPEQYRISVKKEHDSEPSGIVSNFLHDNVKEGDSILVSVPAGDFYLDVQEKTPVILISGGVGVTPMLSMLDSIAKHNPTRPVTFIHAARSQSVHAFNEEVKELVSSLPNGKNYVVYKEKHEACDFTGYVTYDLLKKTLDTSSVVYLCGPPPFMKAVLHSLNQLGVPSDRIHYEFFGPDLLMEAADKGM
ncbi:NO-inducible flavohemoprotein [Jeotgalibacillus campisalis]|uniref:Flavohemoprotein n=1 Tax=Jeotgalibacillus campisalis TaxID=220754 RepID=A0A0C2VQG8_9BACL|nr:NO-inducible flavohemoprotein [Jeotgalibacillus campisalis]KIL51152.1 nitric oxide dioxygenase [Jeotgalibacillus campisalis]